jgi:four helix bundle protein
MAEKKEPIRSYKDLKVWKKAMDLVELSYQITKKLPREETYGLCAQIQRAAVSIPANIAEGFGRRHLGDKVHHFSVANGSLKELETHYLIVQRLSFLAERELAPAFSMADEIGRMLLALINSLESKRG